ncbi:outer membrane beta-barrel protein [Psychroserpens damuponensis]|uniref:outer membrane beta-barrel protein n=1 Tax=Psychroserpens damuponensis TaxID=943936 RepID=UPI00058FFD07|nr:outer membrane beta-barrel protein [Psychroserpens damuponensis]
MKKIYTLTFLLTSIVLTAQDSTEVATNKKFTLSGSIDTYYQTYLTASDDSGQSFGTAFANQTGFALGMGNIIASYENGKVGAVLDLVTGPRGAGATFSDDIVDGIVNQAYAYWNISESTTLTFGRFNTFLGYEVIAPASNFNYSTSYLFSSGPFSHVGLKADFALSDDFSLMLAVMNPWDTNDTSTTGEYSFGAQLGYKGQFLNLYYDSGANNGLGFEVDYTGGFDISNEFFLGINAAYETSSYLYDEDGVELTDDFSNGFYGIALYPQYTLSDELSIGLRGEYFGYHAEDGEDLPSVIGATLTGSYIVDSNLIIKPEIRLDSWSNNDAAFFDADGEDSSSLAAFTIAAIYTF